MFKVGDKLKCIKEANCVYIEAGEIVEFVKELEEKTEMFDIEVKVNSMYQSVSSKNFVKVEE